MFVVEYSVLDLYLVKGLKPEKNNWMEVTLLTLAQSFTQMHVSSQILHPNNARCFLAIFISWCKIHILDLVSGMAHYQGKKKPILC